MKSHLISQVVLKQFANSKREIVVHTKDTETTELKPIDSVAYLDVDEKLIKHLEEKWSNSVEDDADRAINALKNNNLVVVQKHITAIKSLMALHFIRSQVFHLIELNKHLITQTFEQIKMAYSTAYPQYAESIEKFTQAEYNKAPHDIAVKVMEKYIPMVEAYIADPEIGFEIGEAQDDAVFIISDIPTITTDGKGTCGVPITKAKAFGMPLTPKHFVTLKKNPETRKYKKMRAQQVENTNKRQQAQMIKEFYSL